MAFKDTFEDRWPLNFWDPQSAFRLWCSSWAFIGKSSRAGVFHASAPPNERLRGS